MNDDVTNTYTHRMRRIYIAWTASNDIMHVGLAAVLHRHHCSAVVTSDHSRAFDVHGFVVASFAHHTARMHLINLSIMDVHVSYVNDVRVA